MRASNHMPNKVWDEITYLLQNFKKYSMGVWEWISNFMSYVIGCNYFSIQRYKLNHFSKRDPISERNVGVLLMNNPFVTQRQIIPRRDELITLPPGRCGNHSKCETHFQNWYREQFLHNCSQQNVTEPFQWKVSIGSGNDWVAVRFYLNKNRQAYVNVKGLCQSTLQKSII